ncbi:ATP-dependent DNA helicase, RecQ family protein [Besnoitia besnoiti]|uniref:DNA 3'-5' helicase n=1 Tax=Besnoitia besnoiti TaxID=94643 RepID=A0A2A9M3H8_BESBE|nr:ATP-dependent DNA helicase, RecQ family protein [Besnoitia besnoiti]PFH32499.1 ATP-dependent DNA helicase, RecQ family protein [Besnoitia besnoiti]
MSDEEDDIEDVGGDLESRPSLLPSASSRPSFPVDGHVKSRPRASSSSRASSPRSSFLSTSYLSCPVSAPTPPDPRLEPKPAHAKSASQPLSTAPAAHSAPRGSFSSPSSSCTPASSLYSTCSSSPSASCSFPAEDSRPPESTGEKTEWSPERSRLQRDAASHGGLGALEAAEGLTASVPSVSGGEASGKAAHAAAQDSFVSPHTDDGVAKAGARAVQELLSVCNALLSAAVNDQEERERGSSFTSPRGPSPPFPSANAEDLRVALVKAQSAVFDFWPFTNHAQPACLVDFCSLVSRYQTARAGRAAQSSASDPEDSGRHSAGSHHGSLSTSQHTCASAPPARSLILEPSNDEMEDLFAVLTSPNRSVERKKKNEGDAEEKSKSISARGGRPRGTEDGAQEMHEAAQKEVSAFSAPPAAARGRPFSNRPSTVSSGDEVKDDVRVGDDDGGDLDCSLILPPSSFCGGDAATKGEGIPTFSQEDLPLLAGRRKASKKQAAFASKTSSLPTPCASVAAPTGRADESCALLSASEPEEDSGSIASWANARRRKERQVSAYSASSPAASSRGHECGGEGSGARESDAQDPFHVAFQRMQTIFGRGARDRGDKRDMERGKKRATLVCGSTTRELVQDLPVHLRRWFGRNFPFSVKIDRINKEVFGHEDFRGLQLGAVNAIMSGRDCFLVMPTGGGKSLCFQLPAYALGGLTLVISPLLALMGDQLRSLKKLGVEAAKIDGEISKSDLLAVYDELSQPTFSLRILMVTPEFLARSEGLMSVLQGVYGRGQLSLLVIDEAHCVCQWGEDFRADYLSLGKLKKTFRDVPLLALTASASPDVFSEVKRILRIPNSVDFRMSINRPNLFLEVREKSRHTIYDVHRLLSTPPLKDEAGIIYCLSIKDCEVVASHLVALGVRAAPYHAKMAPRRRHETQAAWMARDIDVIVSTVAFGLGVDRPDVRFVFHHSVPPSLERYYQEIGRAGRDGFASRCILFYSPSDVQRVSKLLVARPKRGSGGEKGAQGRLGRLEKMVHFCEASVECRRQLLLQAFGEELRDAIASVSVADEGEEEETDASRRGAEDEGDLGLQSRAEAENQWMRKGKLCARSCDNCWKKTHLTVQYHDVTVYAQKLVLLLLAQERLCGTGYGSGLTRKQLCDAARGDMRRHASLQDKLRHNEHFGCMRGIATGDIETLIGHMVKDRWLIESVVKMKGKFASYVVLRPGEAVHSPLKGPEPLIVPNFLPSAAASRPAAQKISVRAPALSRQADDESVPLAGAEGRGSSRGRDGDGRAFSSVGANGATPQLSAASRASREAPLLRHPRKKQRFLVVPETLGQDPTSEESGESPPESSGSSLGSLQGGAGLLGDDELDDSLLELPLLSTLTPSPSAPTERSASGEADRGRAFSRSICEKLLTAAPQAAGPSSAQRVYLQKLLREDEGGRNRWKAGDQEMESRDARGGIPECGAIAHPPSASLGPSGSSTPRPPSAAAMIWKALSEDTPLDDADVFVSGAEGAGEARGRRSGMHSRCASPSPSVSADAPEVEVDCRIPPEPGAPHEAFSSSSGFGSGGGAQSAPTVPQLQQKERRTHQTTLTTFVKPKKASPPVEGDGGDRDRWRGEDRGESRERGYGATGTREDASDFVGAEVAEREPEDSKAAVVEAIRQAQIDAMRRNGVKRKLPASWLRRP